MATPKSLEEIRQEENSAKVEYLTQDYKVFVAEEAAEAEESMESYKEAEKEFADRKAQEKKEKLQLAA